MQALPRFFLFRFSLGIPCPQAQETQHIHFIDQSAPASRPELFPASTNVTEL